MVAIAAAVCVGLMIDGSGDAGRRVREALLGLGGRRRGQTLARVGGSA